MFSNARFHFFSDKPVCLVPVSSTIFRWADLLTILGCARLSRDGLLGRCRCHCPGRRVDPPSPTPIRHGFFSNLHQCVMWPPPLHQCVMWPPPDNSAWTLVQTITPVCHQCAMQPPPCEFKIYSKLLHQCARPLR